MPARYGLMFSTWIFIVIVFFFFFSFVFSMKNTIIHGLRSELHGCCRFDRMEENLAWIGKNNWIVVGKYFYNLCGVDIFNTNE